MRLDAESGPYCVVEEEFLTKYWNNRPEGTGWTFIVDPKVSWMLREFKENASL